MLSFNEAEKLARGVIGQLSPSDDGALVLLPERTKQIAAGWIFFYNSRQYIETRDYRFALAGNGPIFVRHSGEISILPTHTPWEMAITALLTEDKTT